MTYTLKKDGDRVEQKASLMFLNAQLPSYEKFWQEFVTPLTARPLTIRFKTDAELQQFYKGEGIKTIHEKLCIAQLHYSALVFLNTAWEAKKNSDKEFDSIVKFFSGLYSALDISAELFARYHRLKSGEPLKLDNFDPTSVKDAKKIRQDWQNKISPYPAEIIRIRDYRDNLIHGRMMSYYVTPVARFMALPNIGNEKEYFDWRKFFAELDKGETGKLMWSGEITKQAFNKVLGYLETMWQKVLLTP